MGLLLSEKPYSHVTVSRQPDAPVGEPLQERANSRQERVNGRQAFRDVLSPRQDGSTRELEVGAPLSHERIHSRIPLLPSIRSPQRDNQHADSRDKINDAQVVS